MKYISIKKLANYIKEFLAIKDIVCIVMKYILRTKEGLKIKTNMKGSLFNCPRNAASFPIHR